MKLDTVQAVFEHLTGIPFDTMMENFANTSCPKIVSEKKKRHLKRYLRIYHRHAPEIMKEFYDN